MYVIALLRGMIFYGPIATLYRQAAGISVFQITIIESISLVLCLVLELPWGIAADRIGYKRTICICCGLYFLSKIVFWKASGFGGFLLERVMLSVVVAGLSGVDSSILYLCCDEGKSQRVFGIYNNLQTAGLLFAAAVYSVFIKNNYRLAALLTVFSYGLAAMLALGLTEVRSREETGESRVNAFFGLLRQTVKNSRHLMFLICIALLSETCQIITVFLNQLQYVKCGLSDAAIGYIYIAVTLVGILGVFSDRLTRRIGAATLASLLFCSAAAACIILAVTGKAWLSAASVALLRVSSSLFQPLQMDIQNKQVISQNRATELSINAVMIDSVCAGMNVVLGKLADISLRYAMFAGALLCAVGLLLF
jgi:MFS family permease